MKQLKKNELKKFLKKNPKHGLDIVLVLENIQYASNVASIFRIADAVKVNEIMLTGCSKTPPFGTKLKKTSRSKERTIKWSYHKSSVRVIENLKNNGYTIIALEITDKSIMINKFSKLKKIEKFALILGSEINGITKDALELSNYSIFIPMFGKGASLNVSISCAVALYTLIFNSNL